VQQYPTSSVSGPVRPFLPRLCRVVCDELRIGTLYQPDCCIAATAILIDVLNYFRLTARPLNVIATVYTRESGPKDNRRSQSH
jgi:hypothetical protein